MREVLHQDDQLTIRLVINDGTATVELETTPDGPDLSVDDEVIVAVDGRVCPLEVRSSHFAVATLPEDDDEVDVDGVDDAANASGITSPSALLMVRVHEFFEGWETP